MSELVGELSCLVAAALWAVAVVAFRTPIARHGAPAINLFKSLLAATLLAATLGATRGWPGLLGAPAVDLGWIALSGLIGITVGDTALFAAVARVGAHRTLLLQTLAPVFAAAIAMPLGERLSAAEVVGGLAVLAGVALVIGPDRRRPGVGGVAPAAGIALAVLAAAGQGVGVVVAKGGMDAVPVLGATLLRLAAASLGLLAVGAFTGDVARFVGALRSPATLRAAVPAAIAGTYLAMVLMMAGVAWAPASIAALLLGTSPVFGLVVEAVADRTWPRPSAVVGTLVAVVGIAVLASG